MKVYIISMSFGVESDNRNVDIDKAISNAFTCNTTMFAAAANNGGNKPRAYPANRRNGVICIHASDGRGNDGEGDTSVSCESARPAASRTKGVPSSRQKLNVSSSKVR